MIVLLALIGAFFLGSRNPFIPKQTSSDNEEVASVHPQIDVWISKDGLFVWNKGTAQPLGRLPARIQEYKTAHTLRFASVSGEEMTRYKEIVYALSELKKAGFYAVTVETRTKQDPGLQ